MTIEIKEFVGFKPSMEVKREMACGTKKKGSKTTKKTKKGSKK